VASWAIVIIFPLVLQEITQLSWGYDNVCLGYFSWTWWKPTFITWPCLYKSTWVTLSHQKAENSAPGTVVPGYNPSTWEAEAGGLEILGQDGLNSETLSQENRKKKKRQLRTPTSGHTNTDIFWICLPGRARRTDRGYTDHWLHDRSPLRRPKPPCFFTPVKLLNPWAPWLTPVIWANLETEIKRIAVWGQPREKAHKNPCQPMEQWLHACHPSTSRNDRRTAV
jgi:hypothetical protein